MRVLLATIVIVTCLLWVAGESHRSNCIHEGRTACTVFPWDAGEAHPAAAASTPQQQLLDRAEKYRPKLP